MKSIHYIASIVSFYRQIIDGKLSLITMPTPLIDRAGEQVEKVNNSQFLQLAQDLPPYSILRRIATF